MTFLVVAKRNAWIVQWVFMFQYLLTLFVVEPQRESRAPLEIRLETARLFLRPAGVEDWKSWTQLRAVSAAHLKPWEPLWEDDATTRSAYMRQWRRLTRRWAQDREYHFLIFEKANSALLGSVTISDIKRNVCQSATLGYWLGMPYIRQGFMREAVEAVTAFAFDTLRIKRLEATAMPENERSLKLLRMAGFREIGLSQATMKIAGAWRDHIVFEKIRPA